MRGLVLSCSGRGLVPEISTTMPRSSDLPEVLIEIFFFYIALMAKIYSKWKDTKQIQKKKDKKSQKVKSGRNQTLASKMLPSPSRVIQN